MKDTCIPCICVVSQATIPKIYCIAGNFRGTKYSWLSSIYIVISWILFSWLLLALQVKVGKVASFVGKIFVADLQSRKSRIFCPTKITLYTVAGVHE